MFRCPIMLCDAARAIILSCICFGPAFIAATSPNAADGGEAWAGSPSPGSASHASSDLHRSRSAHVETGKVGAKSLLSNYPTAFEFLPSDFMQEMNFSTNAHWGWYTVSLATASLIVGIIYTNRGRFTCGAIILYVLALSSMSNLIKNVYVFHEFTYPQWLTASHFCTTAVISFLVLVWRSPTISIPTASTLCCGILPVGMVFGLSIGFANRGLLYCNAYFYEMFSAMTCLVTAGMGACLGRPLGAALIPPLLLITIGLLIVASGEVEFSLLSVVFIFLAMVFRGLKAQLQNLLMSPDGGFQQLDALELVFWSSLICFAFMATLSVIQEGTTPFIAVQDLSTFRAVFASAAAACVLNISALYVLKELGPVAQQAVGTLKGVLAIVSSVAVFGEMPSVQEVFGYGLLIIACTWYNRVDAQQKREAARSRAKEDTPLVGPKTV